MCQKLNLANLVLWSYKQLKIFLLLLTLCQSSALTAVESDAIKYGSPEDLVLDYDFAVDLASLPLQCYNQEYPYKPSVVLDSEDDLAL
jgi:hypothetical protein